MLRQSCRFLSTSSRRSLDELRRLVAEHDVAYYRKGRPTITDAQYDELVRELEARQGFEKAVGSDLVRAGSGRLHLAPMLSINTARTQADLQAFFKRVRPASAFTVEYKLDGVAISAVYDARSGRLLRVLTRGDGVKGERITDKAGGLVPARVDLDLTAALELVEVRGEVVGAPRNVVSGALSRHDAEHMGGLRFLAYGVSAYDATLGRDVLPIPSHWERLHRWLPDAFEREPHARLCQGEEETLEAIDVLMAARDTLAFDVDGVVIKVDSIEAQRELGHTRKAPRWCTAVKFAPEVATTTLLNVVLQVSRNGRITPVAELEPVQLSTARIARASLHNMGAWRNSGLSIGDQVDVERAGDVIPQVRLPVEARASESSSLLTGGAEPLPPPPPPLQCPCEARVELERVNGDYFCRAAQCQPRLVAQLAHFCAKHNMNIDGMGPATLEQLVQAGLVRDCWDLFTLEQHRDALLALPGMGERRVDKLLGAVEHSRSETPHVRVLTALGVSGVGPAAADALIGRFGSVVAVLEADEGLEEVVGPKTAASLRALDKGLVEKVKAVLLQQ